MKYRRENKNEAKEIKEGIVSLKKQKGVFKEYQQRGKRLIVGYSEKRAKKDEYNRNKGVDRLEKSFKSGKITKDQVNKRGYNKFLSISENVKVQINYQKIEEDKKWDGLKGYINNTKLSPE